MKSSSISYRIFKSRLLHVTVCVLSAFTCIPLFAILGKVVYEGWRNVGGTFSTISSGIVGTLLMLIMATVIAVPIGVLSGVFLSENKGTKVANVISYLTDLLQGTP